VTPAAIMLVGKVLALCAAGFAIYAVVRLWRSKGKSVRQVLRQRVRNIERGNQKRLEQYLRTCRQCQFDLSAPPSGLCPECGHQNPPRPGSLGDPMRKMAAEIDA